MGNNIPLCWKAFLHKLKHVCSIQSSAKDFSILLLILNRSIYRGFIPLCSLFNDVILWQGISTGCACHTALHKERVNIQFPFDVFLKQIHSNNLHDVIINSTYCTSGFVYKFLIIEYTAKVQPTPTAATTGNLHRETEHLNATNPQSK